MTPHRRATRINSFATLLEQHGRDIDLKEAEDPALSGLPETKLWHLLLSAIEWCDKQEPRVDFDATVADIRQHFATDRAHPRN